MVKFLSPKDVHCREVSRASNTGNQFIGGAERNVGGFTCLLAKKRDALQGINEASSVRIGRKMKKTKEYAKQKRKEHKTSRHIRMGKNEADDMPVLLQESFPMLEAEVKEIYGYRFTKEEDAILKDAVLRYIKGKKWEEEEGLEKMLSRRKCLEVYGCWSEIKRSLPHRPSTSIRRRAATLFDKGSYLGRWSKQETELLSCLQKEHGNQWKYLSTLIGRSGISIKEKWRCMSAKPTGVWTKEEMQRLSDLVHTCLRFKMLEDKSSRQLLRDNVSWDKIAAEIGTHSHANCCNKWYGSLSASMVNDGLWASKDDFLLLESLLESGACMEEEVDWDSLMPHRSGQTCLFRWKQLAKHLGENWTRGFLEKLDNLVRRYAPELLFSNGK